MITIKKIAGFVLFLIFTSFLTAQTVAKSFDLTQEGAMQLAKEMCIRDS